MYVKRLVCIFSILCLNPGVKFGTYGASVVLSAVNPILNNLAIFATIPTSCNNTCNAIEATISDCTTVQCVCTSSNENALVTCVDCLEAVKPNQTVIQQAQDILNQYAALCDAGGISVPVQTASGFSGSVGLSPSTAAASVAQSTNTEPGTSILSSSTQPTAVLSTQTSVLMQSTEISTFASSVTSPGVSSQTSPVLQSTVFASSVVSSLSSLTTVASSVTSSGSSSTTVSSSSATKAAIEYHSVVMLGVSLVLGVLTSCLLVV